MKKLQLTAALVLFAAVSGSRAEVIDDVLSSLSRGASFLERQHEHINLDGVVGFLMLQAELKEAVRTWPHTDPVSWAQRTSAVTLVKRLDQSFNKAIAALQQNDPKYYREFEPLLSWSFWLIPQDWSTTDHSLVYPSTMTTECYDEQLSDKCFTLLLGTWKINGTPCIVTKPCQDTMTRFGCPHYSLSHQLLYFMIGKMKGCTNLLKGDTRASRANMTEQNYQKIFCSNMMKTNQDIIKDGLTEQTVDIFIENILICGLAGFSDFYKADWLQDILRMQDEELGCFGRDSEYELLEQLQPHRRVKRREKILPDGCSSHMTAVAVGALGGYLNYYLTEQDITKRPLS
uniref:ADP-ribosyl cyclase/cyclic ADP-ribose hydrolase n=1 Tax=Monopterus albus TaxID=43700 RepID=A0A3Q3KAM6_MONAL